MNCSVPDAALWDVRSPAVAADAEKLKSLYSQYAPAIFRRARKLLDDEAEAADVTQEVFLDYLRQSSRWTGAAAPFTVLYQMATYQSFDRLRKRARWSGQLRAIEFDEGAEDPAFEVASPVEPMARVEAAKDLALLTSGEDEQTMTIAVLYFVEGHSTLEIADALDLSRKTVGRVLKAFSERGRKRATRLSMEGAA